MENCANIFVPIVYICLKISHLIENYYGKYCINFHTHKRWVSDLGEILKCLVVNSLNFYACCLEDILSVKAEWTLETLLKVGEGKKAWNCDWRLGKQSDGSKFKVPVDGSLKGSVIQVVKAVQHQIVFKPLKL